jgi:predicted deacetylase
MTETNPERFLVVSFHDLSPQSEAICRQFLDELKKIGILSTTLLVVPQFHGDDSIDRHIEFCAWLNKLQEEGHETCLHGYYHRADEVAGGLVSQGMGRIYTAGEGEFYQLDYDQARNRLVKGLEIFRASGLSTEGFIAPAWLLSREAGQAARDLGLTYTTYLQHIEFLQEQKKWFAPTLVFSVRSFWRRWISVLWVELWFRLNWNARVLRLAIHPPDWKYPAIRKMIFRIAQNAIRNRKPATYAYLVRYFKTL